MYNLPNPLRPSMTFHATARVQQKLQSSSVYLMDPLLEAATLTSIGRPNTIAAASVCSNVGAWRKSNKRSTCGICQPKRLAKLTF